MPEPIGQSSKRYMPGLDGLRGVAVLAVIAYHLGFGWASGGLLGVGVFFTLSGYLITDILLERWAAHRLSLKEFWLARARRLLPALLVVLVVVMAWVTIGDPSRLDTLRGETFASAFFISNWWFIFQDVSYFEQFGPPSPLGHIWSLGVEEQFYILWPWIFLGGLALFGRPGKDDRRSQLQPRLALATLGLALVSIILMLVLFSPGPDSMRAYEGTDTRAFGLLIGAALAMVWPSRRLVGAVRPQARRTLDLVGAVGLAGILLLVATTSEFSPFIYRGGLVLLSIATAMVVASVAHPSTRIGRVLGVAPLRWIGVRSYGIYLWQSPIILLTTPALAPFSLPRAVLQVGVTMIIAALSWRFIEDPIRHGAVGRLWKRARESNFRIRRPALSPGGWSGVAVTALVLLFSFIGLAGVTFSQPLLPIASTRSEPLGGLGNEKVELSVDSSAGSTAASLITEPDPAKTACHSVAYIGDSTSLGLVSSDYLPNPKQRIDARLSAVGAARQQIDIAGARSVVETIPGTTNGEDAARTIRDSGFNGCWIFALGTNEAANIFDGSTYSERQRIDIMMNVVDGEPALWVNAKTLVHDGSDYDESRVRKWDQALVAACPSYPEMRVYDWAKDVKDEWYIDDGIHFTSPGYVQRSRLIAAALVSAFPSGTSIVGSGGNLSSGGTIASSGATGADGTATETDGTDGTADGTDGADGADGTEGTAMGGDGAAAGDTAATDITGTGSGSDPSCLVGPSVAALRSPEQNMEAALGAW